MIDRRETHPVPDVVPRQGGVAQDAPLRTLCWARINHSLEFRPLWASAEHVAPIERRGKIHSHLGRLTLPTPRCSHQPRWKLPTDR